MALQRKPVKAKPDPGYPDAQHYANDRRDFLIKLGLTAASLITFAGCGEPTEVHVNAVQTPTPVPVTQPQPVSPVAAMPGAPPPQIIPTAVSPTPAPVSVEPKACTPGKPAVRIDPALQQPAPVQPQAAAPGGVSFQQMQEIAPPALPQAQPKGDAKAPTLPAPVQPQAAMRGEMPAPKLAPEK